MEATKKCGKCQEIKPVEEFGHNKARAGGIAANCKECEAARAKERYERKAGDKRRAKKEWKEAHPAAHRESLRKSDEKRRLIPSVKINQQVQAMINKAIKSHIDGKLMGSKSRLRKWNSRLAFLPYELIRHIESKFQPGMKWSNRSEWHIDHIIARQYFTFDSVEDEAFGMLWELSNLQPLWSWQNRRKHDSLDYEV